MICTLHFTLQCMRETYDSAVPRRQTNIVYPSCTGTTYYLIVCAEQFFKNLSLKEKPDADKISITLKFRLYKRDENGQFHQKTQHFETDNWLVQSQNCLQSAKILHGSFFHL